VNLMVFVFAHVFINFNSHLFFFLFNSFLLNLHSRSHFLWTKIINFKEVKKSNYWVKQFNQFFHLLFSWTIVHPSIFFEKQWVFDSSITFSSSSFNDKYFFWSPNLAHRHTSNWTFWVFKSVRIDNIISS